MRDGDAFCLASTDARNSPLPKGVILTALAVDPAPFAPAPAPSAAAVPDSTLSSSLSVVGQINSLPYFIIQQMTRANARSPRSRGKSFDREGSLARRCSVLRHRSYCGSFVAHASTAQDLAGLLLLLGHFVAALLMLRPFDIGYM